MNATAIRYTLCFLTRGELVLMLKRLKPPNAGLWNGVGGHIEPGESPLDSCLREVAEETGFVLSQAAFHGILTWNSFEVENGGLYLFTAAAPAGQPAPCSEGQLAWQPRTFLFSDRQVVSNLHVVAPLVFDGAAPQEYHFDYRQGQIHSYAIRPLPAWLDVHAPGGRRD
ncbi:MAG: NUDIX domain-containing protein [Anaerolineaceae bacterium]|jgi:8-oxo-dGTP diphosphatase|nr:NUDIX domain-containing protein [Anaerolineaceae bacterium]